MCDHLHPLVRQLLARWTCPLNQLGVVLIDHGSVRQDSNCLLEEMAAHFRRYSGLEIVEPAHMELAPPTLAAAYERCVAQGAKHILIAPFFLLPGRHWTEDIPRLAEEASRRFPHTHYAIAPPLGVHDLLAELLLIRLNQATRANVNPGSNAG